MSTRAFWGCSCRWLWCWARFCSSFTDFSSASESWCPERECSYEQGMPQDPPLSSPPTCPLPPNLSPSPACRTERGLALQRGLQKEPVSSSPRKKFQASVKRAQESQPGATHLPQATNAHLLNFLQVVLLLDLLQDAAQGDVFEGLQQLPGVCSRRASHSGRGGPAPPERPQPPSKSPFDFWHEAHRASGCPPQAVLVCEHSGWRELSLASPPRAHQASENSSSG